MATGKSRVNEFDPAVLAAYEAAGGSITEAAKALGCSRDKVRKHLRAANKYGKPLAEGTVQGTKAEVERLPRKGKVNRYILTSAQNNTKLHDKVWANLLALQEHFGASLIVGTFSYNKNAYGKLAVKQGKYDPTGRELWYDSRLEPYIVNSRVELGKGLVWCGEYNALPTDVNPLAGLEYYSQRQSAIFPHAKIAMRSVATMQGEGTKLNFTTGAVTQINYIAKRIGLIAEHTHSYGGLLVEVNEDGNWWVRQLNAEAGTGRIQDLDVAVDGGEVTEGNPVEAITWGDLHSTFADEKVVEASLDMLDALRPRHQFMHDVLEGSSINHHLKDNPHFKFWNWLRGLHRLDEELKRTGALMERYDRPWSQTVVVDSNHDDPWIQRWLQEYDYRRDPPNSELFLRAQTFLYAQIRDGKMPRDVNMTEWALRDQGYKAKARFLVSDESFLICGRKIECGMHGHLGPSGRRGTPENLSKIGRRANTAHTHSAGIYNGLYVAGTSSKLRWDYNRGPSSWSHSHVVTYPSGKRSIVTIYAGKWRA